MTKSTIIFLATLMTATTVGYYTIDFLDKKVFPLPVYGEADHAIESFTLTNQKGEIFNSEAHKGKIWVVNYFFTICPSVCPKIMRNLQGVHDILRGEKDILLLSFTVDPERDTPEQLMKYLDNFNVNHASWQLLTGTKQDLYRLARRSFLISATEGNGDENDFIHSENIVVIDKEGKIRAMINGTAPDAEGQVLEVISKIKKLYLKTEQ